METKPAHWTKELTRYHWFVFFVAALGWMFDCLDQQLFNLARAPAMRELITEAGKDPNQYAGFATSIFLMGWATGGLFFGVLGDRIGRAKTMLLTILIYSFFTGFSAFSRSFMEFGIYRFLTGLGVGGEFAVGVALVAEVMPDRARPFALGLLQALSAIGNITAAFVSIGLGELEQQGVLGKINLLGFDMSAWRVMFLVGTLPALLAVLIRWKLKEPERWQAAAHQGTAKKTLGSYRELFGDPVLRKRAIIGMLLASAGVIGLWGIGFFSIDFNRSVFRNYYQDEVRAGGEVEHDQQLTRYLVENPDQGTSLLTGFQAADLISPDASSKASRSDAEALVRAAMTLHEQEQEVSVASVLARLDAGDTAASIAPQSTEDRARREAYLNVAVPSQEAAQQASAAIKDRTGNINGQLSTWGGITSLMINIGAFFGIYAFSRVTHVIGRRKAFALSFLSAMLSTAMVFAFLEARTVTIGNTVLFVDVFWMIPIMGFCQLSIFGGYAIYFPELFPTRLRSTGTSFCYNVGRFVAAIGPFTLGSLAANVFADTEVPYRWAGLSMCSIFLLGLVVLPFAPETKDQPLPE